MNAIPVQLFNSSSDLQVQEPKRLCSSQQLWYHWLTENHWALLPELPMLLKTEPVETPEHLECLVVFLFHFDKRVKNDNK